MHLTDDCSLEFGELTAAHIGERLSLRFSPTVEFSAVINAPVYSGDLQLPAAGSEVDAQRQLTEVLSEAGPKEPLAESCLIPLN